MKPLSYFIDTEFSRAVMEEYGAYLQELKPEMEILSGYVDSMSDRDLLSTFFHHVHETTYSLRSRVLFRLGLDIDKSNGSLKVFREVLQEYI